MREHAASKKSEVKATVEPRAQSVQTTPLNPMWQQLAFGAQAKLRVNQPGDRWEREADSIAEQVMRTEGPAPATMSITPVPSGVGNAPPLPGVGRPLPGTTREFFHSRMGYDAGDVRVHDGPSAAAAADSIGARAFTSGRNIVFGTGEYAPETRNGRTLIAHELTHVRQQPASGAAFVQRDDGEDTSEEEVLQDEKPKHKWIKYEEATAKNGEWYGLLDMKSTNPLAPYDPFITPNAFINRVVKWQSAVAKQKGGISFSEFVFAASEAQSKVREGTTDAPADLTLPTLATAPESVLAGIPEVQESVRTGTFKPGLRVPVDGVLGPATWWTMLVARALARYEGGQKLLKQGGVPVDMLAPIPDKETIQGGWRAAHAFLFNKPRFLTAWSTTAQSDIAIETFESLNGLSESNKNFLMGLFFPFGPPEETEIKDEDLVAIMSRGYTGELLEGVASIFEVDRSYYHMVDVERMLRERRPKWKDSMTIRMAETDSSRAGFLLEQLAMEVPTGPAAQAALEKLKNGGDREDKDPMPVLAVVFQLPDKEPEFWHNVANQYVIEKEMLQEAADAATQEHLAGLQKKYEERFAGTPDISKDDASAFLDLLVGNAFSDAQTSMIRKHTDEARGHSVAIIGRPQERKAESMAAGLYKKAEETGYLIVQLGEEKESRFVLPLVQIDTSRERARANGKDPLAFDLIDTPHAAMHMYLPTRFTARKTEGGGSEAARNPWQLHEEGRPRSWENWANFSGRKFQMLDPVLVEMREFNPDAGQLVRLGRDLFGTDKIYLRYVWTLGGSLPDLSDNLWDAQGTINIFGWIDAIFTIASLATLFAAPMGLGASAFGASAASQVARATLLRAITKFVITEAVGELLGRISFYINDSDDVPEGLKKAWNGVMVALMIYGAGKTVKQGIKSLKGTGTAAFRRQLELLEKELEAETRAGRAAATAADEAAQTQVAGKTAEKFKKSAGDVGGEDAGGPGRVRSDDPRTAGISAEAPQKGTLTDGDRASLRSALGDDLANSIGAGTNEITRKRLVAVGSPAAMKKLAESLPADLLTRVLASIDGVTLKKLAEALDGAVLNSILKALAEKPSGVRMLRVFAADPARLATLFNGLGEKTLLSLADNPGPDRLWRLASIVDPALVVDAVGHMGANKQGSLTRFRSMINDVGPEIAAEILNVFTVAEMRSTKLRWKPKGKHTAAQNLARLAIARKGEPTKARAAATPPPQPVPPRPATLEASDVKSYFAVGPEATAPASVKGPLQQLQIATAEAINQLDELLELQARGLLREADLQALAPNARATVDAFLKGKPADANRAALYGSAMQYLAEARMLSMNGGVMPAGMRFRPKEVSGGRTLIPDVLVELDVKGGRAIFDWTTAGEAGKITKYAGGKNPAKWAVELIQPGPPAPKAPPATGTPPIIPKDPAPPADTDVDLPTTKPQP